MKRLLVVEDNLDFVGALSRAFYHKYQIVLASSVEEAKVAADATIAAVLLDMYLEDEEENSPGGMTFLQWASAERETLPIIVLTAHGNVQLAMKAVRLGAEDFIDKAQLNFHELEQRIDNAIERRYYTADLEARLAIYEPPFLIGSSEAMARLRRVIRTISKESEEAIVLYGEPGTGKELVARNIHSQGNRSDGPFIVMEAQNIPQSEQVLELIGMPGLQRGLLDRASEGVAYIDGVSFLSPEAQHVLLEALRGAGEPHEKPQIIASTINSLDDEVAAGRVISELRTQLGFLQVQVPPLRDHPEDIPELAEYFLTRRHANPRQDVWKLASDAAMTLRSYTWPGNVRELRTTIEAAGLRARIQGDYQVHAFHLPSDIVHVHTSVSSLALNVEEALARAELECVAHALYQTKGVKSQAMRLLGYDSRHTMLRRIVSLRTRYPELWMEFPIMEQYYGDSGSTPEK